MISAQLLKDGGIKSIVIKQFIGEINKIVNYYLESLDFFVQFELDENFNETIKSRYRDVFCYENFSEGEKARIDLSLLFTWRHIARLRNSISTNLLIMDEVFDGSLDSIGSDDLIKVLNFLTENSNVVIISHKTDQLLDKFDNVIKFIKVKNFSVMEK
jgi:ABC-type multidrug transport system ATPase subunit